MRRLSGFGHSPCDARRICTPLPLRPRMCSSSIKRRICRQAGRGITGVCAFARHAVDGKCQLRNESSGLSRCAEYEVAALMSNVWRIFVLISITGAASCSNGDKDTPSGNVDAGGSQHSHPTIDSPTDADTKANVDVDVETTGSGPPRQNGLLRMKVTGSGFDPAAPAAPSGQRYFTFALRGVGRTRSAKVK
jgi:hypothetical protein